MATEKRQAYPPRQWKPSPVRLELIDPVAESVCIAGTFNEWRPEVTPMINLGAGRWVKDLLLPPGVYEYCLVVDGRKCSPDPHAGETTPNPYGGLNALLRVAAPASPEVVISKSPPTPRLRMTTMKHIKRVVIAVVGGTVLVLGIVLIVLPGPAFLVIPAGLAILAIEFAWARHWVRSARALMPRRSKDDSSPRKKLTMQSVWRSTGFLLRQVRRTLLLKRMNT